MARKVARTLLAAGLAFGLVGNCGLAGPTPGARAADGPWTAFVVEAEPGTYLARGSGATLTAPDDPFDAVASAGGFDVGAGSDSERWWTRFSAPAGEEIVPGTTYQLGTYPAASMMLTHWNNACWMSGTMTVLEFAFEASSNALTKLTATFDGACGGGFHVELRWDSSAPWTTAATGGPLDFGTVLRDGSSTSQVATVISTGTGPLTVGASSIDGSGADEYRIASDGCTGTVVEGGGSCTILIEFLPEYGQWDHSATLHVATDTFLGSVTVSLTAAVAEPFEVTPSSVDFGSVGQLASATQTITVGYTGQGAVAIQAVSVKPYVDGQPADIVVTTETCTAAPIPTDGHCSITVRFAPTEQREYWASLEITGGTPLPADPYVIAWLHGWGREYAMPAYFTPHVVASPAYSWNVGQGLARTKTAGGSSYLHLLSMTDRVGGKWVTNKGPYLAVDYQRSTSGAAWSTAKRVNPSGKHGYWGSLAATKSSVDVVWVQSAKVFNVSATAPRTVWFRRNVNHGAGSSWKPVKRLSPASGRTDLPSVAAGGKRVLVAWTNSATGAIRLARSTDGGATFRTSSIGKTTRSTSIGKVGLPKVAMSGRLAIVTWIANGSGAIKARISTDGGASWGATKTITGASSSVPSVAAAPGRAAVAFTGENGSSSQGLLVRLWNGAWEPGVRNPAPWAWLPQYDPAVVLRGSSEIGIASSSCMDWCSTYDADTSVDLWWLESPDNGLHWGWTASAQSQETDDTRISDVPSVVWGEERVVAWNAWAYGSSYYRIHVATSADLLPESSAMTTAPLIRAPGRSDGGRSQCPALDGGFLPSLPSSADGC